MSDSSTLLSIVVVGTVAVLVNARGLICLHGTNVSSPEACTDVAECWPWESCHAEHRVDTEGTPYFNFGCRVTQQCEANGNNGPVKRFDLKICDKCCSGDICNVDVCANNTDIGLPCLQCNSVPVISSCSQITYCRHGEVCFTEKVMAGPNPVYNLGCLRKDVCEFFEGRKPEKRFLVDNQGSSLSACHECCETAGCNRDSCSANEETTTDIHTTIITTSSPASGTTLPSARDCWDLMSIHNITVDGVYNVLSPSGNTVTLRCDMTTNGGGWTVFQRRGNGLINFDQIYAVYKRGFGTPDSEFWMGNDLLHDLTKDNRARLRVDICGWEGGYRYAEYDYFMVGPESDRYRLHLNVYRGNAGDALITGSGGNQFHNKMGFSTSDVDHDISHRHCAKEFPSGWWFGDCFSANPNGVYQHQGNVGGGEGLQWRPSAEHYSFQGTEMKFRPAHPAVTGSAFSCPVL